MGPWQRKPVALCVRNPGAQHERREHLGRDSSEQVALRHRCFMSQAPCRCEDCAKWPGERASDGRVCPDARSRPGRNRTVVRPRPRLARPHRVRLSPTDTSATPCASPSSSRGISRCLALRAPEASRAGVMSTSAATAYPGANASGTPRSVHERGRAEPVQAMPCRLRHRHPEPSSCSALLHLRRAGPSSPGRRPGRRLQVWYGRVFDGTLFRCG